METTFRRHLSRALRAGKDPVSGWSHLVGCALALVGLGALVTAGRDDARTLTTSITYGVSVVLLYAASAAYHLTHADEALTRRLRIFDRAAIFLMIAGSCTPFFTAAFVDDEVRRNMLIAVWACAILGVGFKVMWFGAPNWLYTLIYLAMGWMALVRFPDVIGHLPRDVFAFLLAGGLLYSVGAVVYATKWPKLYPPHFGFHELWHFFVLAGSACHYVGIFLLAVR